MGSSSVDQLLAGRFHNQRRRIGYAKSSVRRPFFPGDAVVGTYIPVNVVLCGRLVSDCQALSSDGPRVTRVYRQTFHGVPCS